MVSTLAPDHSGQADLIARVSCALYSDLSQKYLVPKHSLHEKPNRVVRNLRFIAINATANAILHAFFPDCKENI